MLPCFSSWSKCSYRCFLTPALARISLPKLVKLWLHSFGISWQVKVNVRESSFEEVSVNKLIMVFSVNPRIWSRDKKSTLLIFLSVTWNAIFFYTNVQTQLVKTSRKYYYLNVITACKCRYEYDRSLLNYSVAHWNSIM